MVDKTPRELGYFFPAEFAKHDATWLSWPHKEASWPGKIKSIYPVYAIVIKLVAEGEIVNINVVDEKMKQSAIRYLDEVAADLSRINFIVHTSIEVSCYDQVSAFLYN